MYNEQIEALISAALADGVLTEKEKQVLFKKAESMGIDLDEFEIVLDARLVELKKKEANESKQYELEMEKARAAQKSAPKSNKFGDVRKCPSCGAMIESFQTRCPDCGYEFKNVEAVHSAQKLFELLQGAEMRKSEMISTHNREKNQRLENLSQKHNNTGTMAKIFAGNSIKANQDEEREDLIRELNEEKGSIEKVAIEEKSNIIKNFPIPNTKEDLLELLAMATSNAYDNDGVIGKEEEVWIQKTDQIYQKIILCAANDDKVLEQASNMIFSLMKRLPRRYKKFTSIPASLKGKYEEEMQADKQRKTEQKKRILLRFGLPALACGILGIIFLLYIFLMTGTFWAFFVGLIFLLASIFLYKKCKRELSEVDTFLN
jgi:hypothetical protein